MTTVRENSTGAAPPAGALTIGIDTGGTFTDVCAVSPTGAVHHGKAPTTPGDFAQGVLDGIDALARGMGEPVAAVLGRTAVVKHGTTVATNALITRTGPKVGLITTKGFEDTPFIMRAIGRTDGLSEMELRHVAAVTKPVPLVERTSVLGVNERIDYRGEIVIPLDVDEVDQVIDALVAEGCEAIAVSLMHSWANPIHEETIRARSGRTGPDVYWSFGSSLSRQAGEYARTNTAIVDAYLGRTVDSYLESLDAKLRERGFTGALLIMQGAGGVTNRRASRAIGSLQSGPSGGVSGAQYMATLLGHDKVLTADMGGTSFDVSYVADASWRYADEPVFDRLRLRLPVIELESIGAGGGTVARIDPITSRLQVGPASAGAVPGPACYLTGGADATVTDADVVLGYIEPAHFLNGEKLIDPPAAAAAIHKNIAEPLGIEDDEAAWGVYEIVNNKMADLIRKWVVKSGHLPEEFILYAFGGASGLHAARVAAELKIDQVVFFPTSGVFSAFGGAVSDVIHTQVATLGSRSLDDPAALGGVIAGLQSAVLDAATADGIAESAITVRRFLSMRFRRQTYGLQIELPWDRLDPPRVAELEDRFVHEYEVRYGRGAGYPTAGIEAYELRIDAVGAVARAELASADRPPGDAPTVTGGRRIYYAGDRLEAQVHETADLTEGVQLPGPCLIEAGITTMLVPPAWSATLDRYRNVMMRREEGDRR